MWLLEIVCTRSYVNSLIVNKTLSTPHQKNRHDLYIFDFVIVVITSNRGFVLIYIMSLAESPSNLHEKGSST
jgi:hypothetical protein